jgi:hypothetical protein
LNASAFDLSGLTSLRLGSIGAQLGELVNEFSSDDTLSGDSNAAVPTEAAVRGYFGKVATNLVPLEDDVQTLGTPSKRWNHLYVGPGTITIGTLTISDNAGTFEVKSGANAAPSLINAINNGTSNVSVAAGADVTITAANTLAATFSGANTTLAGELRGPSTFTIDPAVVGDDTGTVIIKGNLQVDGTTTTINSTTLTVDDKNIELASVASPTDTTADGAGITIKGATDKTLNWVDATDAWTSSEHLNLLTGKEYYINGTSVLSGTTLGSGVTASSLTSVGTLTSLTVNSGNVLVGGTGIRASTAGTALVNLFNGTAPAGTLTSGVSLYSASGDFNFMDAVGGAYKVGFRNIPAVGTKTSSYTLATSDVGKYVQVGTSGSITIPNSTFAEGDVVSIFNNTGGNITITCSISTAYIGGTDSDKDTVTLATRGVATVMFISATVCVITGNVS